MASGQESSPLSPSSVARKTTHLDAAGVGPLTDRLKAIPEGTPRPLPNRSQTHFQPDPPQTQSVHQPTLSTGPHARQLYALAASPPGASHPNTHPGITHPVASTSPRKAQTRPDWPRAPGRALSPTVPGATPRPAPGASPGQHRGRAAALGAPGGQSGARERAWWRSWTSWRRRARTTRRCARLRQCWASRMSSSSPFMAGAGVPGRPPAPPRRPPPGPRPPPAGNGRGNGRRCGPAVAARRAWPPTAAAPSAPLLPLLLLLLPAARSSARSACLPGARRPRSARPRPEAHTMVVSVHPSYGGVGRA